MKKNQIRFCVTAACCLSASLISPSSLASPASDRAAINTQTQRLSRAFETKDFAAWHEVFADDLRALTPDGKTHGKAEFIKGGMHEAAAALPPISVDVRNTKFDLHGRRATVQSHERTCYTLKAKSGQRYPICYSMDSTAEWRKDRDGWKIVAMHDSPNASFTLAGKPITIPELRKLRGD